MKKSLSILFQIVIVLVAVSTLVFMLWEPHLEGRNANATVTEIYFNDPFLAYAYAVSVLFFVALYQSFKVFGLARENNFYSSDALKSLKTIKYCSMLFAGFVAAALGYIIISMYGKDDIAGGVAIGLFLIIGSIAIAATSAMFERIAKKNIGSTAN